MSSASSPSTISGERSRKGWINWIAVNPSFSTLSASKLKGDAGWPRGKDLGKSAALLTEKCGLLAESPEMGRHREELSPRLRSFPVGRYVIFYRTAERGIEVARIVSAYRDIGQLF